MTNRLINKVSLITGSTRGIGKALALGFAQEGSDIVINYVKNEDLALSLKQEIKASLKTLKQRERDVIIMYFGIDREYALTLNEIGEEFDLTRERVRQIKEKAIRRLRHRSRSKKLRMYLG